MNTPFILHIFITSESRHNEDVPHFLKDQGNEMSKGK
jgi:hypothetical protein